MVGFDFHVPNTENELFRFIVDLMSMVNNQHVVRLIFWLSKYSLIFIPLSVITTERDVRINLFYQTSI